MPSILSMTLPITSSTVSRLVSGSKRIGDAVEFAPRQLGVVVLGIVFVVLEADGRNQAMGHQRAGGRDRVNQTLLDHVADDQSILPTVMAPLMVRKRTQSLSLGHRLQRFSAARHLRRHAAVGSPGQK